MPSFMSTQLFIYARLPRLSLRSRPACPWEARGTGGGQAPRTVHHEMGRGIERMKVFRSKYDRLDFIARMGRGGVEIGELE